MPTTVMTIGRGKIRVSDVNRLVQDSGSSFFTACNDKYEKKMETVAKTIAQDPSKSKLIMLSGPSASGKTTTSIKLQLALQKLGIGAVSISMDDFFKNREDAPTLPDGTKDFESLASIDIELMKNSLNELINTGKAALPMFNFKTGRRSEKKRTVELDEGHVAVVEGLHALDTEITGLFPEESTLKIYVSVSSDFVDDQGNPVLCAREIRLVRRTVRDYHFRSSSPDKTLDMWDTVCEGEDLYVRPFKKFADVTINSVFACEPCLFQNKAKQLFATVKESDNMEMAKKIIKGLSAFKPLPEELMPGSCLLREFIGGSEYYTRSGNRR